MDSEKTSSLATGACLGLDWPAGVSEGWIVLFGFRTSGINGTDPGREFCAMAKVLIHNTSMQIFKVHRGETTLKMNVEILIIGILA